MRDEPDDRDIDLLEQVEFVTNDYDACVPDRSSSSRMRRCERLGLLESTWCDDPQGRHRIGYQLTKAGREVLASSRGEVDEDGAA